MSSAARPISPTPPATAFASASSLAAAAGSGSRNVDDFHVAGGTFATSYSDLPYHTVPIAAEGFDLRILKVPVADILLPLPGLHDLVPKPFTDRAVLIPLLESCFTDLTEADDDSDPATTKALVRTLTHLTLIERGVVRPTSRVAQYAVRAGRLSLARRLMARHIARAATFASVCRQSARDFGSSSARAVRRSQHELFANRHRAAHRRSRRLLREAPAMTIAEIAFASGFDSLATFYRVFRAAQGITPGDFREAATSENQGRAAPPVSVAAAGSDAFDRQMTVWPLFVRKH